MNENEDEFNPLRVVIYAEPGTMGTSQLQTRLYRFLKAEGYTVECKESGHKLTDTPAKWLKNVWKFYDREQAKIRPQKVQIDISKPNLRSF